MKKTIPILLSAALLLSACGQAAGTAETTSTDAPAAVTETTAQTSAPKTTPGGVDKAETVYAKADADGTVTETTVEAVLKARDGATIEDVAALRDIINKEGDEAYTTGADNALTWENSGNAITYEGKSDAALPVTTRVTYYLNGMETAPADLAGQSGRVRIRFDYTNHTRETVTVDGQEYTVCVPFAAITAVILDGDKFSNIETDNGKVMELDGTTAVLGTAMPGLADSLRLTEFEPLEDTEIPAYFEVSADVTDFSLDFTATILTPSALDNLDTGDLSEPAFSLFNVDDSLEDDRRGQDHDDTVNADREIAIVFYEALTFTRRCIIARMEAVCGGRSNMVRNRCRAPLCRRWCGAFGACRVVRRIRRRWSFCSTGGLCRRYGL